MHFVGDLDSVAVGLPVDAQQDGRLAVGRDDRIDRLDRRRDRADVPNAHRHAVGRALTAMSPISSGVCTCAGDEAKEQLVVALEQPGRIDQVGAVDGVEDVGEGDAGHAACAPDRP